MTRARQIAALIRFGLRNDPAAPLALVAIAGLVFAFWVVLP